MPTLEQNRMNNAATVIERLPDEIKVNAAIVGRWVWVRFLEAPSLAIRQTLKTEGFHWNEKRKAWQHCGGIKRRFNHRGNPLNHYTVTPAIRTETAFI